MAGDGAPEKVAELDAVPHLTFDEATSYSQAKTTVDSMALAGGCLERTVQRVASIASVSRVPSIVEL